jgi:PAS domain S-box-containing protein
VTPPKILIIDDDDALLEALPEALRLRMKDVVVHTSDSASAALDRIRTTEYDAFICDIKMPGMDGLTLLEEIRKVQPDTPTLLITGHGQHDLAVQALRRGAHDFIQKPIDREYLIASLNRLIEMCRLSRAIKQQRTALERHAGELEMLVQKRTHELLEANLAKAEFIGARDQALAKAETAEERYRLLVEGVKDYAIFMVDTDGQVAGWNAGAEQILGYQTDEIMGCHLSRFFTQDDAQRGNPASELTLAAQHGRFVDDGWRVRKSGSRFWANTVTTRLSSKDGRIVGFSLIIRDLTERKRAEEELLKASKLESLGILAAGIAHDFNNILTTIVSNLYLAKESLSPDDTRFKRLSEAERGIHRAQGLTQQLLTFSRGGAPIRRPTDLVELLRVSATFAVQGSVSRCEFALSSNLWTVEIDEGQVGQVIHNLVINAQQAMPDGGNILIRAQNTTVNAENHLPVPDGRYVLISVKDQGIGISEENLSKVFDPFFTTKPKGSGLGLSTSYWIVKRHHGHVTVKSEPGKGATFSIYLPASPKSAEPARDTAPDVVRRGIGRVLLMDDEAPLRDAIGQVLGGLGYSVTLAADGAEAIDLYRKAADAGHPFDAVMLDLTVPGGMGGKEAIQQLRKSYPDIKAIVSSGYSEDPIMAQYQEHGFIGVATKPYRISELSDLLRRTVSGQATQSEDRPPFEL